MKVLLTHGYFLGEDEKEKEIMRPYPPLGLLSISAYLKHKGIQTKVFDTTFFSRKDLFHHLEVGQYPVVGLYVNLMTRKNVLAIIRFIREHPQLSKTKIVVGGPEVRYHAEGFLRHGASACVIGEGEESMLDLVQTWATPFNPFMDRIKGIAFLNALNEITYTEERDKIKDVDALPFPDREGIDLQKYYAAWKSAHGQSAVNVNTMRGCPYTCKWCSRAVYGLSYRRRSPEFVVQELAHIQANYPADSIWFTDDVFTVSHKWLRAFAEALKASGLTIRYECISRSDRMNEEVIALLKETGCFRIWIGAESGSQRILDAMDRRVDAQQVREMIRKTSEAGIETGTFIMLGYPGETREDIEETIRHLKEADPDHFTLTVAYPIKGTPLYEEVESRFLTEADFESGSDRDIDFKRTFPRKYYDYAVRRVNHEVRAHKAKKKGRYLSWFKHRLRVFALKRLMNRAEGGGK